MIILQRRLPSDAFELWLEATGEVDQRGYVLVRCATVDPRSTAATISTALTLGPVRAFDPASLRAETREGEELLAAASATRRLSDHPNFLTWDEIQAMVKP